MANSSFRSHARQSVWFVAMLAATERAGQLSVAPVELASKPAESFSAFSGSHTSDKILAFNVLCATVDVVACGKGIGVLSESSSNYNLTIRLSVLLAFVVGMPVLALPKVNRWLDERLFAAGGSKPIGRPESGDGRLGPSGPTASDVSRPVAAVVERLTPADVELDGEQFRQVQSRLQELGVEYLVLEKAVEGDDQYRFHCRLAVPGNTIYARPFEARDADPLRAMQRVLTDVEAWMASHK